MGGRTVTLVVLGADGEVLGALPPFGVELPWWQETGELVAAAREQLGAVVDVLRVLEGDRAVPPGGWVSYLAQVRDSNLDGARLGPVDDRLVRLATEPEPLRMPYARPGGPATSVAWGLERLPAGTRAVQQRTWNLSAIWRLVGPGGTPVAWLKQVPPFFGHESAALGWVGGAVPGAVPELLAADDAPGAHRLLLAHAPGTDLYEGSPAVRIRILALAQQIHERSRLAVEELVAAGIPDRRGPRLATWVADALADHVENHPAADLVAGLPDRLAELDACGLPDVLVHGDLHPGNAIGDEDDLVLVDWGDCFLGHPGFDILRLTDRLPAGERAALVAPWSDTWRAAVPGCEPERALRLLEVVEGLRGAAVYAAFLAHIEPAEHPYHRADVPDWLDRAAAADPDVS